MEQIFMIEVFVKKIVLKIEPPVKDEYELRMEEEERKREAEAAALAEALLAEKMKVAGLIIGGMLGSFFLRSARKWPLFIGGGTGVGMAYANCEKSLNEYLLSLEPDACLIKKQA
ncbi:MICOS complex subunit Mic10-like isoform X2 [Leguminivora glycinivorella]|uniref:MICOS complex subunit Mic10-like isoform X2 n=1 Tax=Leguminivora glycinivorella TaxID=1035111 RepID=UPI00200F8F53|nr:MICOS complex subunit Mic10-like isoform X2 [Leguminivora glycinivorella]